MGFKDALSRRSSRKSSTTASMSSATRPSFDDADHIHLSGLPRDKSLDRQPRAPALAPLRKMFTDNRSWLSSSSRRSASTRKSVSSDAAPPRYHSVPFLDLSGGGGGRAGGLQSRLSPSSAYSPLSRAPKSVSLADAAPDDGRRAASPTQGSLSSFRDGAVCAVAPFFRSLAPREAVVPAREVPQGAGAVVSDQWLEFVVPEGWQGVRSDVGFRLVSGPCVGFARATAAKDASAALCDTSQLAVLDAFDVSSSPSFVRSANTLLLAVEYRNRGAGRGLALIEDNFAGAVVFGLSGPTDRAQFLRETEQQLLSSARVVKEPSPEGDHVPPPSGPLKSAHAEKRMQWCVLA